MIPQKKLKSIIKHSQVTTTSKKCIINPKKAALSFKFMKNQGMSGSQDQKKTASTVTTNFCGQKITTAQIRFYKDHYLSRTIKGKNNEYIKMT